MKKVSSLMILLVASVMMFVSCSYAGNSGNSGGIPSNPTDISFGGKTFKLTGSVQLMTAQATITGSDDLNLNSSRIGEGAFPQGRKVTLSPFIMGKYEVTQELYEAVMTGKTAGGNALNAKPSYCTLTADEYKNMLSGEEQQYRPVENVTWFDAVYFCNALSEKMGFENAYTITDITVSSGHIKAADVSFDKTKNGYRLPTEAEWEYAARGGSKSTETQFKQYWSGATTENYSDSKNDDINGVAWYYYNAKNLGSGTAGYGTHQVGKKAPNAAGLCDMSGNVLEWCYDWYTDDVTSSDNAFNVDGNVTDPSGPSEALAFRVVRGGDWGGYAGECAVSGRSSHDPRGLGLGFRVVRSAQ